MQIRTTTIRLLAAGALLAASSIGAGSAHAQTAVDDSPENQTSCAGVFEGDGDAGTLTKSLQSVTDNGDGTFTIVFDVTTTRPAGTYRLRDCAFTDQDGDQMYDSGEPLFGTDEKTVTIGEDGATSASITVRGSEGDTVCDRVALSGDATATDPDFTDKSNVLCTTLTTFVVPPGAVGALGLAGLVGVAALVGITVQRSRRRTVSVA